MPLSRAVRAVPFLALSLLFGVRAVPLWAESRPAPPVFTPTYADLADLADNAPLVMRAKIRKVAEIKTPRSTGATTGLARVYIEAVTENLFTGPAAVGESLRYLADIRRDAKGKLPKLTKQSVLLFARHVPGHPGELQLIAPDAQIPATPASEEVLRSILTELFAPGAPPRVTGVHEAIFVAGNLVGEGESQIFLTTANEEPAAITVRHQTGQLPKWSASFSEVVDSGGLPPRRDSLPWYRLACFLPAQLPAGVNVSAGTGDRSQAEADYRLVMADLGPCPRNRGS